MGIFCLVLLLYAFTDAASADEMFPPDSVQRIAAEYESNCSAPCTISVGDEKYKISIVNLSQTDDSGVMVVEVSYNAGSAGYPQFIMRKESGTWRKIAETFFVQVGHSTTNGYFDLIGKSVKFVWNKHEYVDEQSYANQQLTPRGNYKPSFDCAQAKTASARLICADAQLAQLDSQLGAAFQDRKSKLPGSEQSKLVAEEVTWIRDRNKQCQLQAKDNVPTEELASFKPCMIAAIRSRISEFSQSAKFPSTSEASTEMGKTSGTQVALGTGCLEPLLPAQGPNGEQVASGCKISTERVRIWCTSGRVIEHGNEPAPSGVWGFLSPCVSDLIAGPSVGSPQATPTDTTPRGPPSSGIDVSMVSINCSNVGFSPEGMKNDIIASFTINQALSQKLTDDQFVTDLLSAIKARILQECGNPSPPAGPYVLGSGDDPRKLPRRLTAIGSPPIAGAGYEFLAVQDQGQQDWRIQTNLAMQTHNAQIAARNAAMTRQNAPPVTVSGPLSREVAECAKDFFPQESACLNFMRIAGIQTLDSRDISGGTEVLTDVILQALQPMARDNMMAQLCFGGSPNDIPGGGTFRVQRRIQFEKWGSGLRCLPHQW